MPSELGPGQPARTRRAPLEGAPMGRSVLENELAQRDSHLRRADAAHRAVPFPLPGSDDARMPSCPLRIP